MGWPSSPGVVTTQTTQSGLGVSPPNVMVNHLDVDAESHTTALQGLQSAPGGADLINTSILDGSDDVVFLYNGQGWGGPLYKRATAFAPPQLGSGSGSGMGMGWGGGGRRDRSAEAVARRRRREQQDVMSVQQLSQSGNLGGPEGTQIVVNEHRATPTTLPFALQLQSVGVGGDLGLDLTTAHPRTVHAVGGGEDEDGRRRHRRGGWVGGSEVCTTLPCRLRERRKAVQGEAE